MAREISETEKVYRELLATLRAEDRSWWDALDERTKRLINLCNIVARFEVYEAAGEIIGGGLDLEALDDCPVDGWQAEKIIRALDDDDEWES